MLDKIENNDRTVVEIDQSENLRTEARLAAIAAKVGAASTTADVDTPSHAEERRGILPDLTINEGSDPQNPGSDEAKTGNGGKAGDDSKAGCDSKAGDDGKGGGDGGRFDKMF